MARTGTADPLPPLQICVTGRSESVHNGEDPSIDTALQRPEDESDGFIAAVLPRNKTRNDSSRAP
jgi:hypothetical protein